MKKVICFAAVISAFLAGEVVAANLPRSHDSLRKKRNGPNNQRNNKHGSERLLKISIEEEDALFWSRFTQISSLPPSPTPMTKQPTRKPTRKPTKKPTSNLSPDSSMPTILDTPVPTINETPSPTIFDEMPGARTTLPTAGTTTNEPTTQEPSSKPTSKPTITSKPTKKPTKKPTSKPTAKPTNKPTKTPAPTIPVTPAPTYPCNLTPKERANLITALLGSVSNVQDLATTGTSQQKALDWIINHDTMALCPSFSSQNSENKIIVQRYVMAVFYYSTEGDSWNNCNAPSDFGSIESILEANAACVITTTNATQVFPGDVRGSNAWLSPESECLWGGISCYPSNSPYAGKVNVIEFESNGLSGTLPYEIQELDRLRFFALERGSMSGPIPSEYGNLNALLLMDFDYNELSGPIPSSLWTLSMLRQLDLNDNNLSGEIPPEIGNLMQLRFLQIDNNEFTGEIPTELGSPPNLSLVGISGNKFVGAMPQEVCDLRPSPLQTLVVDCNIECQIPQCCTECSDPGEEI